MVQSAQPIISFNYGAGNHRRVRSALRLSLTTAVVCGLIVTAGMWVGVPMLSRLFISPADSAYAIAADGLSLLGCCFLILSCDWSVRPLARHTRR